MKKTVPFFASFLIVAFTLHAQVVQINSNKSLKVAAPISNNRTFVVSDIDSSIWVTDATLGGTFQLSADIKFEDTTSFALLSGKIFFRGTTSLTGSELYMTDGTVAGTMIVSDIVGGATGSEPGDLTALNGFVYFSAVTAAAGRELWKTNGTSGNASMVKDILVGPEGSNELNDYNLFANGTYLLFAAKNSSSGIELWKTDGSEAGTVLLKDINLNPTEEASSSSPESFYKFNNTVLFVATDTAHGREIWKTDGTPTGTVMIDDINPGKASSTSIQFSLPPLPPFNVPIFLGFHLFQNKVYFNATNGSSNAQIWSYGGTGTAALLKDVFANSSFPSVAFTILLNAVNVPGKFIFPVSNSVNRFELWESDGTADGTKLFKAFSDEIPIILLNNSYDFATGNFTQPLFQGNKFFFIAHDAEAGRELWISDGSLAQTAVVKDINPDGDGIADAFTRYVYTTTDLFFSADDGDNGNELWRSNGTSDGTTMAANINPLGASSNPELPFFLAFGKVIFSATNGDNVNTDLYVVDGTFIPLPIKVSEFTVMLKTEDALLRWSTSNEVNSKDFTIQRSYDGLHFENIGTVPAASTSAVKHEYLFVDERISNSGRSIIYYRIIANDKNGKSENTNIIFVKLKGDNNWNVRLLTNPVVNDAVIMLNGVTKEIQFSIKDISGKTFYKTSRPATNGQISIPVTNLPRGVYILLTETNNEKNSIKFMKQ